MPRKLKWKVVEKKLGREGAWGQAYENIVEIDPRQKSRTYMDTLIHECIHLAAPDWSETKVKLTARKITKLLWEKNFRRIQK